MVDSSLGAGRDYIQVAGPAVFSQSEMDQMDRSAARDRLRSLRDEVYGCYTSSPSTEIRHAMLIIIGKSLSSKELDERWERFTKSNFLPPPLSRGSFRRDVKWKHVENCLFGEIGDREFSRFKSTALEILPTTVDYLAEHGFDYSPIPHGFIGLLYLLYCMAWDHPSRVAYSVKYYNYFDELVTDENSPFERRESFEAWEMGRLDPRQGLYFSSLSKDIRSCTASAVDAMLSLEEQNSNTLDSEINNLSECEEHILEALADKTLVGREIAKLAGYSYESHFRGVLSNMKKRGLLSNSGRGYKRM